MVGAADHSGDLYKLTPDGQASKRWFVLSGTTISIHDSSAQKVARRQLDIAGAKVERKGVGSTGRPRIQIRRAPVGSSQGRVYDLEAENSIAADGWMEALQTASGKSPMEAPSSSGAAGPSTPSRAPAAVGPSTLHRFCRGRYDACSTSCGSTGGALTPPPPTCPTSSAEARLHPLLRRCQRQRLPSSRDAVTIAARTASGCASSTRRYGNPAAKICPAGRIGRFTRGGRDLDCRHQLRR